jgi:hypothetical protein
MAVRLDAKQRRALDLLAGSPRGLAYVGVKTTLEGQAASDAERRAQEIAAIRLALHTEIGMIALICVRELEEWRALRSGAQKDPRTARLPPLTIYNSVCGNVGRLTREEIVPLIKFASTLHDIETVAAKMAVQSTIQTAHDQQTIALLLSNACGYAAEFYEAILGIPDAHLDQRSLNASRKLIRRWTPRGIKPPSRIGGAGRRGRQWRAREGPPGARRG